MAIDQTVNDATGIARRTGQLGCAKVEKGMLRAMARNRADLADYLVIAV